MLGPVNHIAIAVPDLDAAIALYQKIGAQISSPPDLPEHGVTVASLNLAHQDRTSLSSRGSPFSQKNASGGIHHICFDVDNIHATSRIVSESGARILGSGAPKIGAHGFPILFAHQRISTELRFHNAEGWHYAVHMLACFRLQVVLS